MKALKRKPSLYEASNVTFDSEKLEAFSYKWWQFVKVIEGKLVFNHYNYSPTTVRHLYKVKRLMNELGIVIDREVSLRGGLNDINSIGELNRAVAAQEAENIAEAVRKRFERNEKARARRAAKKLSTVNV